jgi:hypothetical protein
MVLRLIFYFGFEFSRAMPRIARAGSGLTLFYSESNLNGYTDL